MSGVATDRMQGNRWQHDTIISDGASHIVKMSVLLMSSVRIFTNNVLLI